jgi:hypothetical protein
MIERFIFAYLFVVYTYQLTPCGNYLGLHLPTLCG